MLRKFGFHLVIAGNRYTICGQWKHAIREYMCVLPVFEGDGWNCIRYHVHFNLGRWYVLIWRSELAIQHLMRLLACSHQSAVTQEMFQGDFLRVFESVGKKDEMFKLKLPAIDMTSLRIHFEDHRTYASAGAILLPEKTWQYLEEGLVPSTSPTSSNWFDFVSRSSSKSLKGKDSNICIAGEAIIVELEFNNPLHIPIDISAISLICDFIPEMMSENVGVGHHGEKEIGSEIALSNHSIDEEGNIYDRGASSSILSEEAFSLKGGQSMMVHLKVTPKMDGFQHTLIVYLYTLSSVPYKFSQGKCTVPKIMLLEDIRLLQFKAFHSWHTELFVHIKVDILPNPRLEIVSVPDQTFDDGVICHAYDESTASQSQISNQTMVSEVRLYIETFMSEMVKWENDLKQLGTKVKKREDELRKLETNLSGVNSSLSDLERELNKCTFSSKSDGKANSNPYSHSVEDTLEENQ